MKKHLIRNLFLLFSFLPFIEAFANWNSFIINFDKNLYGKGAQTWEIAPYDDKWVFFANKIRGEKRNVSICGRLENDWLLWLSKRYDEVGESDLEKRNVYIALHWAYILASFERRSNGLLYIEGRIGEISGLFTGYSPWTFPDQLSYTKIVKRIGLCKWSGGMPDALPFFILSKLFHIDNIWYICSQINAI